MPSAYQRSKRALTKEFPPMRIVAIRDIVAPIKSDIANAYIDFSTMTVSVVAVVTDVMVEGRPVVGFGFNSNGRYAPQGLLRERFIPRLLNAAPEDYQGEDGFIDPHRGWSLMMKNESPAATASARSQSASSTWRSGTLSPRRSACRSGAFLRTTTTAAMPIRRPGSTLPAATITPARA
jgi:hypothetical protein